MEIKYPGMIMRKLGEYQAKHPFLVIAAVLLFTVLTIPGLMLVYFDTSNENFLPGDDPVVISIFKLGNEFGALDTMDLIFVLDETESGIKDLRDPLVLEKMDMLEQSLLALDYVDEVNLPVNKLKALNNGVLPKDRRTVELLFHENPELGEYYNSDYSVLRGFVSSSVSLSDGTSVGSSEEVKKEIEDHFSSIGFPEGVEFRVWGFETQFIELEQNMGQDLGLTSIIAFIAIFLLIVIFYRSPVFGVLALMPIVFSLIWTIGTMGYIGLPFTMLTTGFIPIVLGFGVDFGIHIIHSINHLRENGKKMEDAVIETMGETGETLFGSTITTGIGFISLLLASLLITQRLGMTLALSVIYIFVGTVVLVPPVIIIKEMVLTRLKGLFKTMEGKK